MRTIGYFLSATLILAIPAAAAEQKAAAKPSPAPIALKAQPSQVHAAPAPLPVLGSTKINPGDSPLVRLAKQNRARAAQTPATIVIDDANVKSSSGTVWESAYVPPAGSVLSTPPEGTVAAIAPPPSRRPAGPTREELTKQLESLEKLRDRVSGQADELYPNEMSEDAIDAKMQELQKAIDVTKQQLGQQ